MERLMNFCKTTQSGVVLATAKLEFEARGCGSSLWTSDSDSTVMFPTTL